ncbi:MAG: penicillin acylase family protein [Mucilaginibacter polytrichastri]|nr:penicillin acylase family protein [Mucilaginibacter polytrichastri]
MKTIQALLVLLLTAGLIFVLQTPVGPVPALGPLLNPSTGFWQNAEKKPTDKKQELRIPGLQKSVQVFYDENHIPHIFAQNNHDLYIAQGYVTAVDRLWQMDIQTRSASGRLSEVVGEKALETDRYHRRMGMVFGAEKTLEGMMADPEIREAIENYTAGINARIDELKPKDYPLEYKLIGYKPEKFKPLNCALLLKLMSETLAGGSNELYMTALLNKFGRQVTEDLFPNYPQHEDPIIPAGTPWDFKPLPVPEAPQKMNSLADADFSTKEKIEGLGSNNFAVGGSKSENGYPILANDPHLAITLPSIWYQIQLHAPGVDTYGVSIPGAPCVIIGFNRRISWGVTNVDADVLDWYQVKFKDASHKQYWYNNQWKATTTRLETIRVKGKPDLVDTVFYTHHGPVVYLQNQKPEKLGSAQMVPVGHALRWVAHDRSDDIRTFYMLNRAKNYTDYREALKHYTAPAQNFIFASIDKDIAITPNGKFPLKYKLQGKYILDGSDPADDWHGWIPPEQNPTVKNPARGFVSSANQSSTDPSYPYYLNWEFAPYERGHRINTRLAAMKNATIDSIRALQTDVYGVNAANFLPLMLKNTDRKQLDAQQLQWLDKLARWNYQYDADKAEPSVFTSWYTAFFNSVWADELGNKNGRSQYPNRDRFLTLVEKEPDSRWFDNINTPGKETLATDVTQSFRNALDTLRKYQGNAPEKWAWGKWKGTEFPHLAHVPGLGTDELNISGWNTTVNAMTSDHGPSWRMVVQTGPTVTGFGVIPGGQSGNPGSFYYDNQLPVWMAGKLNPLHFPASAGEAAARMRTVFTLKN